MSDHHNENEMHSLGYSFYIFIWLILVALTGLTIVIASIDMGSASLTILVAMFVATVKASLVIGYFMHLAFESFDLKWMVGVVIIAFAIFNILTFTDILYR